MKSSKRNILITGGCGFVGRHLLARLSREAASEFWVVDDLSTGKHPETWEFLKLSAITSKNYPGAETFEISGTSHSLVFIRADFMSVTLSELGRQPGLGIPRLPKFDEIYHLASVVGGRAMIDGDPLMVGIDLGIDACFFLWASKVNKPGRILYASSSAAYPVFRQTADKAQPLRESEIDFSKGVFQPDYTYGWSKLTGEYLAGIAAGKYGLKVAVVRPFSGYGEDQDLTYPVPAIALRVAARQNPVKIWGSGEQSRDFVYIGDCAEACVRACRGIEDGSAVNIGSGVLTSFNQLARLMMKLEGYQGNILGDENKPVGVAKRCCDPKRVREKLQWEPAVTLEEGMAGVLKTAHQRLNSGIKIPE